MLGSHSQGHGHVQPLAVAKDRGAVDHGGQFADVARPGVGRQQRQILGRGRDRSEPESRGRPLGEVQGRPAMSSRRSRSGGSTMGNTAIRYHKSSRNRPWATIAARSRFVAATIRTLTLIGFSPADALHPAVLQDAQHPHLGRRRQFADLVEEQRAAVGPLEPAPPGLDRAGERAPLMTEQLRVDQLRRNRAAVDPIERPAVPRDERLWIVRAINSLPVPVSPKISTGASERATSSTRSITAWRPASMPTIWSPMALRPNLRQQRSLVGLGGPRKAVISRSRRLFSKATENGSRSNCTNSTWCGSKRQSDGARKINTPQ